MSLEESFLEDIRRHPEDDAPRLVYADWLDEHDEPERAEFIRLQCELARWGGWPEPDADDRPRFGDLLARVGQLAGYHDGGWLPGWPAGLLTSWNPDQPAPGFSWWHRGFLAVVRLTAADWVAHADRLTWHPSEGRPCPVTAHPLRVVRLAPPAAPRRGGWPRRSAGSPATGSPGRTSRLSGYSQPGGRGSRSNRPGSAPEAVVLVV